jgi:hypothetical protein
MEWYKREVFGKKISSFKGRYHQKKKLVEFTRITTRRCANIGSVSINYTWVSLIIKFFITIFLWRIVTKDCSTIDEASGGALVEKTLEKNTRINLENGSKFTTIWSPCWFI